MKLTTRQLTKIAVISGLSAVLMYFEFPLPFAPSFMGVDFSDVPILMAGFSLGPFSATICACLKIVIKLLLKPTSTMFVGELSNLLLTVVFVVVGSLIYKKMHNFKGAIIALLVATLGVSVVAFLSNGFVIYPLYASLLNQNIEGIIKLTASLNSLVSSYWTMMLFMVIPFNLVKYSLVSIITLILYKKISPILKN